MAGALMLLPFLLAVPEAFWNRPIASAQRLLPINFVLAFAQSGVHFVFFLHLGSGPDSTNNILALAFGVLIVFLVIAGSVWIFANLNSNVMPMLMQ